MKENAIYINTLSTDIPDTFDYRKGNRVRNAGNTLISFEGVSSQLFHAEGRGENLNVGDVVFFTLKSSKTLVLPLTVNKISYLIEPADHWKAELIAKEPFDALKIYTWQVQCNECNTVYPLEFVVRQDSDQAGQIIQAEYRLSALGWKLDQERHICPNCLD